VDGFHGARFNRNLPRESATFTSAPLTADFFWIGTPKALLQVGSFYEKFPLHIQISEVSPDGTRRLVNRIPFTARGWNPGDLRAVEMEGLMHAHRFSRGSRIRIDITNIDAETKFLWGNVPFSVPMFAVASAALFMDSTRQSYIELPSLGNPGLPNTVESLIARFEPDARRVRISWQTGAELMNGGFVVERSQSPNGLFAARGFVRPEGGPDPARYEFLDTLPPLGRWHYRIRQIEQSGVTHLSEPVPVDIPVAVVSDGVPQTFALEQNYPNPFNPATNLGFAVQQTEFVTLKVYDLLGREVATLVNEQKTPGRYTVKFDGANLPSGVYIVRMIAGDFTASGKMVFAK
jgi:hypothetical protein